MRTYSIYAWVNNKNEYYYKVWDLGKNNDMPNCRQQLKKCVNLGYRWKSVLIKTELEFPYK